MNKITDFHHPEDSSFVGWIYKGNTIKKNFNYKVYTLVLKSEQKILVIELNNKKNNSRIFNGDGSEFRIIKNPDSQALCFDDVYYVNDEFTLISRKRDSSMLAVVINKKGDLVKVYETR